MPQSCCSCSFWVCSWLALEEEVLRSRKDHEETQHQLAVSQEAVHGMKEELDRTRQADDGHINQLKEKMAQLRQELLARLTEKEQLNGEVQRHQVRCQLQEQELQRHQREYEHQIQLLQEELNRRKEQHEESYSSSVRECTRLEAIVLSQRDEIQAAEAQNQELLEGRREVERQIQDNRRKLELKQLEDQMTRIQIEEREHSRQTELQAFKIRLQQEKEREVRELEMSYKDELADVKQQLHKAELRLQDTNSQLTRAQEELETQINRQVERSQHLQTAHTDATKTLADVTADRDSLKRTNRDLQRRVTELQAQVYKPASASKPTSVDDLPPPGASQRESELEFMKWEIQKMREAEQQRMEERNLSTQAAGLINVL